MAASSETLEKGLRKGAEMIKDEIKVRTPVDTGFLRERITVEKESLQRFTIGTNVEYAPYVEFGTGQLGDPSVPHTAKLYWKYYDNVRGQWVTTHGQRPVHFFQEGFYAGKDKAVQCIADAIKEAVQRGGTT